MNLLAVLRAELLKLRGTLALWMCLIAPGLVVAMTVLQIAFRFSKPVEIEPHEAWMMLARAPRQASAASTPGIAATSCSSCCGDWGSASRALRSKA